MERLTNDSLGKIMDQNGVVTGFFIMTKIDMIKMVREVALATSGHCPGLEESKDAVEVYIESETLPLEAKQMTFTLRQVLMNNPTEREAITKVVQRQLDASNKAHAEKMEQQARVRQEDRLRNVY